MQWVKWDFFGCQVCDPLRGGISKFIAGHLVQQLSPSPSEPPALTYSCISGYLCICYLNTLASTLPPCWLLVPTASSLQAAQTQHSWTWLFHIQLPAWTGKFLPCCSFTFLRGTDWSSQFVILSQITQNWRAMGQLWPRWGCVMWSQMRTRKKQEDNGMGEQDRFHGQLDNQPAPCASLSLLGLVETDYSKVSSCHLFRSHECSYLQITTLRNFQKLVVKA